MFRFCKHLGSFINSSVTKRPISITSVHNAAKSDKERFDEPNSENPEKGQLVKVRVPALALSISLQQSRIYPYRPIAPIVLNAHYLIETDSLLITWHQINRRYQGLDQTKNKDEFLALIEHMSDDINTKKRQNHVDIIYVALKSLKSVRLDKDVSRAIPNLWIPSMQFITRAITRSNPRWRSTRRS